MGAVADAWASKGEELAARAAGRDGYDHLAGGHGLEDFKALAQPGPPAVDDDAYKLVTTDWQSLIHDGVPEIEFLDEPYIPKGARVWLWGATGTSKSIWALWVAAALSRLGITIAYFSEENPLVEDLRRLSLIKPDPRFFRWFHRSGMDLTDPLWIEAMLEATQGCGLVVFDTWTDLWHGEEDSNGDVRDFDVDVLKPIQAQGGTPVVIHHTGHAQLFSGRGGATAGRGASALGQKADVALEFKAEDDGAFTIVYGKARMGGERQPDRTFRVVDLDDEDGLGLDIIEVAGAKIRAVDGLVEKMVHAILTAPRGYFTNTELRTVVGGGRELQTEAFAKLEEDHRVEMQPERVPTGKDNKIRLSKVWRARGDGPSLEAGQQPLLNEGE